jgi:hypothetical protein
LVVTEFELVEGEHAKPGVSALAVKEDLEVFEQIVSRVMM